MGKNTGSKVTIRSHLIVRPDSAEPVAGRGSRRVEVSGSNEAWYGGYGPCREATPCFGTQPHCLQVQLARHCLLANEPSASVAPSEVWCRRRDCIRGGCSSR